MPVSLMWSVVNCPARAAVCGSRMAWLFTLLLVLELCKGCLTGWRDGSWLCSLYAWCVWACAVVMLPWLCANLPGGAGSGLGGRAECRVDVLRHALSEDVTTGKLSLSSTSAAGQYLMGLPQWRCRVWALPGSTYYCGGAWVLPRGVHASPCEQDFSSFVFSASWLQRRLQCHA